MDISEPRSETALIAALCLTFKLTRSEAHTLALLVADGHATKRDLIANESALIGRTVSDNTIQTIICALRKKLTPHGVIVTTIPRLGYGLDKEARNRIGTILTRYDTGFVPKHPRKPKVAEPETKPSA